MLKLGSLRPFSRRFAPAGGPGGANLVVDVEPGAEDGRVADPSRNFPGEPARGGHAADLPLRVDAVAIDGAVEMVRIDDPLGDHLQLDPPHRLLPLDWIEVVKRVGLALPAQPGGARSFGVEIVLNLEADGPRELLRPF